MKLTKKVLYNKAKTVKFDKSFQNQILADEMVEFMKDKNGIGLAAPQIGRSLRVFVMEVHGRQRRCFNPEIIKKSDVLTDFDEGCLSFSGQSCKISRPDTIIVRYQDYKGDWTETNLVGLESRCFQHELDHLDGITMWDRHKEQNAK